MHGGFGFWYVLTMREADQTDFKKRFFQKNPGISSVFELFESLPQIVFYAKDEQSRFVRGNARFLEKHNFESEAEMIGRSDRDFHPPVMAEAYIAEDRRVMEGRVPVRNRVWLVMHPHQTYQWYVSTKTPLFGSNGKVIGLAGVMYEIEQPAEQERYFRELAPVIQYIKNRYSQVVSMTEMASLSGLSSTHFNRRFQQLLRMTPGGFLRSVRIQAARHFLSHTDQPLASIAQESGFTDQSHFTRCFRESTGMTPAEYRKRFRSAR